MTTLSERHLQAFKERMWPNIVRDLKTKHGIDLLDKPMPEFAETRLAYYYAPIPAKATPCKACKGKGRWLSEPQGKRGIRKVIRCEECGAAGKVKGTGVNWERRGPLPADEFSIVQNYRRGWSLYPPPEEVEVEQMEPEGSQAALAYTKYPWHCDRLRQDGTPCPFVADTYHKRYRHTKLHEKGEV